MKPVEFPEQNCVFGEGQKQYQPLPALSLPTRQAPVITCWELTNEEIEVIRQTKRIYVSQLRFFSPRIIKGRTTMAANTLQPIYLTTDPKEVIPEQ